MPTPASNLAIDLHDVAKTYRGKVAALRGIEMQVQPREIFGLLGPNGAGKSTLVKIMMTVVRPTRAHGFILGQPIGHKPTLRQVGYLSEQPRFPGYLRGRQMLELYAALADVDRPTRKKRAGELLALVGMADWAEKKLATYSKGMLQRVALAQALMNDPQLVVVDEPTDGVDPVGRRDIRNVLMELKSRGKTIFINSHLLSELEMLCDRVAILSAGQVVRQGTIDQLTVADQRYEIEVAPNGNDVLARIQRALAPLLQPAPMGQPSTPASSGAAITLGRLDAGEIVELEGSIIRIVTIDPARIQGVIDRLRAAQFTLRAVRLIRPSLEDLFMEVVDDAKRAGLATVGATSSRAAGQAGSGVSRP